MTSMYLRWSGDSDACWSSIMSCDSEMIEFSGVRSSWLSREVRLFFSRSEYSSLDSASNSVAAALCVAQLRSTLHQQGCDQRAADQEKPDDDERSDRHEQIPLSCEH